MLDTDTEDASTVLLNVRVSREAFMLRANPASVGGVVSGL